MDYFNDIWTLWFKNFVNDKDREPTIAEKKIELERLERNHDFVLNLEQYQDYIYN